MSLTADTLRALFNSGDLDLPQPGNGDTAERHLRLYEIARGYPVSVARLAEAHTDAVAILREAGHEPHTGAIYGVWASSSTPGILLERSASARIVTGSKPFCSGAGIVDRALVTVIDDTGQSRLVDVDARPGPTVTYDTDAWRAWALKQAATGLARFDGHSVSRPTLGEMPDWYLRRPGFWYGACGPAACWAGSAAGLVDVAQRLIDDDPHRRATLGAMRAAQWAMEATLRVAGLDIDDASGASGHRLALSLRHTIERFANDILDRFGQALGPRPFVSEPETNQRWADTHLYLRQHHGDRDLAELGRLQ